VVRQQATWETRGPEEADLARAEIVAAVSALLQSHGVEQHEITAAIEEDRLDLLVIDRLLLPSSRRLTGIEVIEEVGMPAEIADRYWRALGFAEPHASDTFSDADGDALRTIQGLTELGITSHETAVQVTRVLGSSMARLADTLVSAADATAQEEGTPSWVETPADDGLRLAEALAFSAEVVMPNMEQLILYAWRRHIQAAARRRASLRRSGAVQGQGLTDLTVGFADMVGFTALSSQLNATALARVVDRFEELAHGIVVNGGGRAVKMIGDEVMFVTEGPLSAVMIALDLVDAYADDDLLSDVRVGIATGPVLQREGDFFGAVVNRASRIVNIADAGTVLISGEVREFIEMTLEARSHVERSLDDEAVTDAPHGHQVGLTMEPLKPRELKDIGRVVLWSVKRAGRVDVSEERRSGIRWRRLSAFGAELESLRSMGERAMETLALHRAAATQLDDFETAAEPIEAVD
jgi:adenylate cyclase